MCRKQSVGLFTVLFSCRNLLFTQFVATPHATVCLTEFRGNACGTSQNSSGELIRLSVPAILLSRKVLSENFFAPIVSHYRQSRAINSQNATRHYEIRNFSGKNAAGVQPRNRREESRRTKRSVLGALRTIADVTLFRADESDCDFLFGPRGSWEASFSDCALFHEREDGLIGLTDGMQRTLP